MSSARPAPRGRLSVSHAWSALRHRNYRLFFMGQSVSLVGTWMTRMATAWLVYRLTHSPWLLGVVGFAGQVAAFVLAPFAGVWVERLDRRRVMVWTQVFSLLQSLALGVLTLMHVITVWEIIALSVLQGLINAFDVPARQSFVIHMVDDRADLPNAIALNSSMVNGGRIIGPAIAAAVIKVAGEGWCFMLDAASYLAVIASLLLMTVPRMAARARKSSMLREMRDGWDYVTSSVPIRTVLLYFVLVSFTAVPYMTLLPVFATQVLHGDAGTQGWLSGASGVGALLSALSLALRRSVIGLGRMLVWTTTAMGAALIAFGFSRELPLSAAMMVVAGFGLMQGASGCNTVIQSMVSEDMRARVMSFYTMAFFGAAPIGSLVSGAVADRIGAPVTVVISGGACLLGSAWLATKVPALNAALAVPREPLRAAA